MTFYFIHFQFQDTRPCASTREPNNFQLSVIRLFLWQAFRAVALHTCLLCYALTGRCRIFYQLCIMHYELFHPLPTLQNPVPVLRSQFPDVCSSLPIGSINASNIICYLLLMNHSSLHVINLQGTVSQ